MTEPTPTPNVIRLGRSAGKSATIAALAAAAPPPATIQPARIDAGWHAFLGTLRQQLAHSQRRPDRRRKRR